MLASLLVRFDFVFSFRVWCLSFGIQNVPASDRRVVHGLVECRTMCVCVFESDQKAVVGDTFHFARRRRRRRRPLHRSNMTRHDRVDDENANLRAHRGQRLSRSCTACSMPSYIPIRTVQWPTPIRTASKYTTIHACTLIHTHTHTQRRM